MKNSQSKEAAGAKAMRLMLHGVGHVVGVVALTAGLMWVVGISVHDLSMLIGDEQMRAQSGGEMLQLVASSVCCWVLGWASVKMMGRVDSKREVRRVRIKGQVLLETLIVIPVLLVLILGSVQFALRMTAGLLTTLGAYQAGRAASIWYPETEVDRRSAVTLDVVKDKAKLAAASSIAPAAPANFAGKGCSDTSASASFEKMQKGMEGGIKLDPIPGSVAGLKDLKTAGGRSQLVLSHAFDSMSMKGRAVKKLQSAYCNIEVSGPEVDSDRQITTTITYRHQAVVPIAEVLFGEPKTHNGMYGYYSEIVRSYTTRLQIPPNPYDPL